MQFSIGGEQKYQSNKIHNIDNRWFEPENQQDVFPHKLIDKQPKKIRWKFVQSPVALQLVHAHKDWHG